MSNLRAALLDELDAPGTITKSRLRNVLIANPEDSEMLDRAWEEGALTVMTEHGIGKLDASNPYRLTK